MNDEYYMQRAIELAKKGAGFVNPNPMVGAVIVKDGKIIGEGYHQRYGDLHAERNALKNCTENPEGATIYVTLEPCCHYGKTPPCTEAIIEKKLAKVVIGAMDANPLVAGKGARILQDHGIEVVSGVLEDECVKMNRVFYKYITTKEPYVVMKYAMTADGKIATRTGESKWITGEKAREAVHKTRNDLSAIMVGVETVIMDDPLLTCRLDEKCINPVRIICDSCLRTPIDSKVVRDASDTRTIIATTCESQERIRIYEEENCQVLKVPSKDGKVDLKALMKLLGEMEIDSVLLEGGGTLNYSAITAQIVDEVQIYMAPKIFGGNAKSPVEGIGVEHPADAVELVPINIQMIGDDILIENEVKYGCSLEL